MKMEESEDTYADMGEQANSTQKGAQDLPAVRQ